MAQPQTDLRNALGSTDEVTISVTGRKSGRRLSFPVWFVLEGDTLLLLPVKGLETEWYQNLREQPAIGLGAGGVTFTTEATLKTDAESVRDVVAKFQDRYGEGTENSLYSGFDAAVTVSLR